MASVAMSACVAARSRVFNCAFSSRPLGLSRTRMSSNYLQSFPASDARIALLLALTSQAAVQSQRAAESVVTEASKYILARRGEAKNLEEAFMTVPDLETIPYKVVIKNADYEVREVQAYMVAETDMAGTSGFDFIGSGQAFNTLADYIFGKNIKREALEMTTPVFLQKSRSQGEKMEMTTPVISQKGSNRDTWRMAFVLPSKYSENDLPIPENSTVKLRRVPSKTVAVTAFSGFVTDEIVKQKDQKLRQALEKNREIRIKDSAQVEVAQFNPPFTPPFMRRNEISIEVEYEEMI